jgi:uncharacterized protein (UPF0261 family)
MDKTILLIATFDTKESEAIFLKDKIESRGYEVFTMDAGILDSPLVFVDVDRQAVAKRGGMSLDEALATGDKGTGFNGCFGTSHIWPFCRNQRYHHDALSGGYAGTQLFNQTHFRKCRRRHLRDGRKYQ